MPGVVFLDEPYAGVDVVARTRIYQRINSIKKRTECSMVLTSHSGGNKRKLSIAVALIGMPGVVFLDEPYAGVDVVARTRIYQKINGIKNRTECSVVLTSHSGFVSCRVEENAVQVIEAATE
ncbi:hypothetical protein HPB50_015171 [Hyalomma asiaticum]|uniref:Uncharacterized protein n=1 Tax=Hyalomma asiaticum TaxID=266040 RepID=A0ACB7S9L6_HYAAI|nr:hypothetical protein HPB50_015171 [Hyalomma asiaticum]